MEPIKLLPVYFFQETSGSEPVKKWLHELSDKDRKTIGKHIRVLQIDWPVGSPLVKPLGKKLWELRISLDNRIARIIFIFNDGTIVLLHGFIKKTQKTPLNDLEVALKRAKKSQGEI